MFKNLSLILTTNRRSFLSGLIGLGALALSPAALSQAALSQTEAKETPAKKPPIEHVFTEAPDDHVLGADFAPNTLIAYASVTCSHCGSWFTKDWPKIKSELVESGRIRFIFREFPTQPANMAMAGFFIANCAAQNEDKSSADHEAFFEAIEYQMENQDMVFQSIKDGKVQETYAKIGKKFGLEDLDALNECFSNKDHYRQIDRSVSRAFAGKVSGTPFFIINGEPYTGGQSAAEFIKIFDNLEKKGVSTFDKSKLLAPEKP